MNQVNFFPGETMQNMHSNDIEAMASAMAGDIIAVVFPATKSTAHASAASRTVYVELQDSKGLRHSWCNKTIDTIVTAAKSSSGGTVTVADDAITFENGVATIPVTIGGTWVAADTNTITIAQMTILGATVAAKTSVETMS